MSKSIYNYLWFENNTKAASEYDCSIFKNSKIISENPFDIIFEIHTTKHIALNARALKFNEFVSLVVNCDTQGEIDTYWLKLTKLGEESMCSWLKDKYRVSWQIVPTILGKLIQYSEEARPICAAFMKMKKINMATLHYS